jgi:PAS domain S-box-containing protein
MGSTHAGATLAPPIRVLVAEDEHPLHDALCDLVGAEPGLELAGSAMDAEEAIEKAQSLQPDVALLDVRMPGGGGPRAVREIGEVSPATRSVALSAYEDRSNVLQMLRAGAIGYVVKGDPAEEILDAIRRAARGQASFAAGVVAEVVSEVGRDIAERDEAVEAQRQSESRFRSLLESAPDAIAIVDREGRIVIVNAQTELLFGYRREELLGRPVEMLLPRRFRAGHTRDRRGYFADPSTRPMGAGLELCGLRKDGTEFPVDVSLSAIETDEGRLAAAFIRDVTDRRSVELARRRSQKRFEALLESAPDAVVIIGAGGEIVLVNEQTENLFGYGREELLGEPVEILMPERFRGRHLRHRTAYLADPRTRPMGIDLDLAGRRKDGTEFPVDISLSGIETEEGRLAAAFVRDVTEQRARADLERDVSARRAVLAHLVSAEEEERRRIAADIHDDSIQVMTAAGMRLQIFRRELRDPIQLERLAELERTVQLAIARLRHLLFALHPPALDHEGVSAALRLHLDEAAARSKTSYRLVDRLTVQPPDATRVTVYRIARELLVNVEKHAHAENATVTLAELDGGYLVNVADDGVGFSFEHEPLPGHLGLEAVRQRTELAGGWLRIESMPGEGTTVDFWIPALRDLEPAAAHGP